jgi:translation initiation factor 2 beta subunit (eIF-2beta)/eIF-5
MDTNTGPVMIIYTVCGYCNFEGDVDIPERAHFWKCEKCGKSNPSLHMETPC